MSKKREKHRMKRTLKVRLAKTVVTAGLIAISAASAWAMSVDLIYQTLAAGVLLSAPT